MARVERVPRERFGFLAVALEGSKAVKLVSL